MSIEKTSHMNPNPWEGKTWEQVVEIYKNLEYRHNEGEKVLPPPDCPVDHLMPMMIDWLPAELKKNGMIQ